MLWFVLGLQNEIAAMDTFGQGGPSNEAVPYLSTSHYLRERVGTEKSNKRSSASADSKYNDTRLID